jgi:hypothetical protein
MKVRKLQRKLPRVLVPAWRLLSEARCAPRALLLFALLLFALCSSSLVHASCDSLEAMQHKVYGFQPLSLSEPQREAKQAELQEFWLDAKALGPAAVPCLETMLSNDKQDSFFLFDGAWLLFSLDKSPETLSAVSAALSGTDLRQVRASDYIGLLLRLSRHDVDIGPLAEKYMDSPSPDALSAQTAKQDRVSGALLLYGSMHPELAEKYLEPLARNDALDARPAAVFALALTMTEASFRAFHAGIRLDGLSPDNQAVVRGIIQQEQAPVAGHTPLSREQVLARLAAIVRGDFDHFDPDNPPFVAGDDAFEVSAGAQLLPSDLPALADARRLSVRNVSDDSVDEYLALTHVYLEVINRYDLYKKWRAHSGREEVSK